MSAFTFDFDLEDDLDESFDAISLQDSAAVPPRPADRALVVPEGVTSEKELPAEEIPISALLSALPEALSYSPLALPGDGPRGCAGHTLARRDLFDARFQLLLARDQAEQNDVQTATAFVDAPADLVPGVYEGGLKTWECALDLAAYLDQDMSQTGTTARRCVRGLRVLEAGLILGCGTAVPTLLLLDRLFAFLASKQPTSEPATELPSGGANDVPPPETQIHLQDYNRSVLELVTLPNVLIAWYLSPLSAEYRSSAAPDSGSDDDGDKGTAAAPGRGPGALTVTQALLAAFTASLDAHNVHLRFFAGGWASLRERLLDASARPQPGPPPESESESESRPPYDIVLASETIYRAEALDAFLGVLRAATTPAPAPASASETRDGGDAAPAARREVGEARQPPLCLVAAKVLYFGVGGGVEGFVRAVEAEGGAVRTVWERREGVGRRIMRVEWVEL
ncbi:hypothetical protein BJV78DRAFT_1302094 [Lactifluus subvellereus]|nr:hypothetical protein BJV78DRAFT_1302094 [Lactifluus subvellereus]